MPYNPNVGIYNCRRWYTIIVGRRIGIYNTPKEVDEQTDGMSRGKQ